MMRIAGQALLLLYNLYAYPVCLIMFLLGGMGVILLPGVRIRRRFAAVALKGVFMLLGIRWQIEGLEHWPEESCVVVSNHTSYVDGLVLQMVLPPEISFAIMAEIKNVPPAHWALARLGAIFITRTDIGGAARQTREMLRKLQAGECIGIFAEGRMGKPGELQAFRRGAFMLATHGQGSPVLPIMLRGPDHILPSGSLLLRPSRVHVRLLPASMGKGQGREAAIRLSDNVHQQLSTAIASSFQTGQGG